ncbi:hypothetical protein M3Y97_00712400 [Aphelenchoides bicaudatus]|nr:hypothetical protein M3Y97_00712400 [Aphelenchoides bicaudatus]
MTRIELTTQSNKHAVNIIYWPLIAFASLIAVVCSLPVCLYAVLIPYSLFSSSISFMTVNRVLLPVAVVCAGLVYIIVQLGVVMPDRARKQLEKKENKRGNRRGKKEEPESDYEE